MSHVPVDQSEYEAERLALNLATSRRVATWRFWGERDAATAAYCVRFGVAHAPEPLIMRDNVWSFPLPTDDAPR